MNRHKSIAVRTIAATVYDWMDQAGYLALSDEEIPLTSTVHPDDAVDLIELLQAQGFELVETELPARILA